MPMVFLSTVENDPVQSIGVKKSPHISLASCCKVVHHHF